MRILHAIHDYLPKHRSGSEIYAHSLARAQAALGHEVSILCAESDGRAPTGAERTRVVDGIEVHELVFNGDVPSFGESYLPGVLSEPIRRVLRRLRPEIVHVHSLLNLSFELPRLARLEGAAVVATLHDFTLFCASGGQRVHVAERHVCDEIEVERCARCFKQSSFYLGMRAGTVPRFPLARLARRFGRRADPPSVAAIDLERRLEAARATVREIDLFVSPSRALAKDVVRFGVPADRIEVSDYGFEALPVVPRRPPDGPLRIGFIGTLIWHKGPHVLLEAARRLPPDAYAIRLHGVLDWFPDYVAELRMAARGLPVEFRGGFGAGGAARILAELDVIVVPSLWPENSPLVIHEAFQARVPVVGARRGGIPELVSHGVDGMLFEPGASEELAATLKALAEDRELLAKLASAAPGVKPIEVDAGEWDERYRRVRAGGRAA